MNSITLKLSKGIYLFILVFVLIVGCLTIYKGAYDATIMSYQNARIDYVVNEAVISKAERSSQIIVRCLRNIELLEKSDSIDELEDLEPLISYFKEGLKENRYTGEASDKIKIFIEAYYKKYDELGGNNGR